MVKSELSRQREMAAGFSRKLNGSEIHHEEQSLRELQALLVKDEAKQSEIPRGHYAIFGLNDEDDQEQDDGAEAGIESQPGIEFGPAEPRIRVESGEEMPFSSKWGYRQPFLGYCYFLSKGIFGRVWFSTEKRC